MISKRIIAKKQKAILARLIAKKAISPAADWSHHRSGLSESSGHLCSLSAHDDGAPRTPTAPLYGFYLLHGITIHSPALFGSCMGSQQWEVIMAAARARSHCFRRRLLLHAGEGSLYPAGPVGMESVESKT